MKTITVNTKDLSNAVATANTFSDTQDVEQYAA